MNKTSIEWTDFTWNPIRARLKTIITDADGRDANGDKLRTGTFCTRISPGCTNCYASIINKRFGNGLEYTVPNLERVEFFLDEQILAEPLKRKKPASIFVGDMFDLFHEAIPDALIAQVFRVICEVAHRHTFHVLTKRAERMQRLISNEFLWPYSNWPNEHVWLGVSVESQKYADERIPFLERTPAAVRFLSVEPMLEAVDLRGPRSAAIVDCGEPKCSNHSGLYSPLDRIDWVICGGESGHGARPFNLAWAESLLKQCRSANVPFFMKQMGSNAHWQHDDARCSHETGQCSAGRLASTDPKGGDPAEWPDHVRVREFPLQKVEVVSA